MNSLEEELENFMESNQYREQPKVVEEEVRDCEFRVYGISTTDILEEDVVNMSDEEWVEEAEHFGYISTLDTFIHNVNKGIVAKDYSHLEFRVIPVGYYDKRVDVVPTNKLHYIIRY
tara:strand:+ start:142 stop:492 length:351 start_codon:yes stop_codon:yes gene_type:complete